MSDELRRRLREADRSHAEATASWADRLRRAVGSGRSGDEVAALLGVPTRRQVLRLGGTAIAGAVLLGACSDDDEPAAGDRRGAPTTTGPEQVPGPDLDLVLVNTAISVEAVAVSAYGTTLASGLVERDSVRAALTMFQAHHAAHRDALVAIVQEAGGEPFTTPNPVVRAAFVDPGLASAAGEGDLVRLAHQIEQAAAQTYVHATGSVSTATLRATTASIAGVEARHAAVLHVLGELSVARPARYLTENPLPADALVTD